MERILILENEKLFIKKEERKIELFTTLEFAKQIGKTKENVYSLFHKGSKYYSYVIIKGLPYYLDITNNNALYQQYKSQVHDQNN